MNEYSSAKVQKLFGDYKKAYYFCSLINPTKNDYEKNSFIVGLYCCKYFN